MKKKNKKMQIINYLKIFLIIILFVDHFILCHTPTKCESKLF